MGRIAVILIAFVLCSFEISRNTTLWKDLRIYYPLSGTKTGGLVAFDARQGVNNKDTLRGNAIYKANSVEFDGSGDFISIVHNDRHVISDRFTISLWMRPLNLTQSSKHLFSKVNATFTDNNYAILWEYSGENDQVSFYAGGYTGTNPRTGSQMTIPNAVNWHHVVYTYDGATLNGYVDGVRKISVSTVFSLSVASSSFLSIGGNYQFGNQFAGRMRQVMMYGRPLTHDEVIYLYIQQKKIP